MPTNDVNATVRAEFDSQLSRSCATISAQGTLFVDEPGAGHRRLEQAGVHRRARGFNDQNLPRPRDQRARPRCTRRTTGSAVMYSFNYDVLHSSLMQQRISAFYNAQCCGLAIEYQTYNYGAQLGLADSAGPPLLPVVHAGGPRQLLAVQRRAERRAG